MYLKTGSALHPEALIPDMTRHLPRLSYYLRGGDPSQEEPLVNMGMAIKSAGDKNALVPLRRQKAISHFLGSGKTPAVTLANGRLAAPQITLADAVCAQTMDIQV